MNTHQNIFTARFNEELKRSGLNKATVSRKIDVSKSTISRYSDGSILPNAETLANMCDLFKCSADFLLGLSQSRTIHAKQSESLSIFDKYEGDLESLPSKNLEEIISFIEFQLEKNRKKF